MEKGKGKAKLPNLFKQSTGYQAVTRPANTRALPNKTPKSTISSSSSSSSSSGASLDKRYKEAGKRLASLEKRTTGTQTQKKTKLTIAEKVEKYGEKFDVKKVSKRKSYARSSEFGGSSADERRQEKAIERQIKGLPSQAPSSESRRSTQNPRYRTGSVSEYVSSSSSHTGPTVHPFERQELAPVAPHLRVIRSPFAIAPTGGGGGAGEVTLHAPQIPPDYIGANIAYIAGEEVKQKPLIKRLIKPYPDSVTKTKKDKPKVPMPIDKKLKGRSKPNPKEEVKEAYHHAEQLAKAKNKLSHTPLEYGITQSYQN